MVYNVFTPCSKRFFGLIFLLILTGACGVFKRNNPSGKYFHGFIYTVEGDSLEGRIKVKALYDKKVSYIPDGQKKKRNIPVRKIEAMRINLMQYGKVEINNTPKLLEKVAYGRYNLYAYAQAYKDQVKTFYYFEFDKNEVIQLNRENYLRVLEYYLIDVPEIEKALYNEEVAFEDVVQLVRNYNQRILKN